MRYAALTGYPELARTLGLDPARLMASVGLDIVRLSEQDTWVAAVPVARLLERSARESGCEDLGVRLAGLRRFSALGPLSVVLREEPDLRSALDLLTRYEHAYNGILDLRLAADERLARVEIWLEFGAPVPVRQALDLTVANLVAVIRALVGAEWTPLSTCFAHPPPADLTTFHRAFGPGLRFDHPFTSVVFPARDLDLPTQGADPAMRAYTRQFLQTVAPLPSETARDRVRSLVEVLLPAQRCTMAHVGRALGMQPRTLHRHLADEGQTFSGILHDTRAALAERYLANDRYSVTEVSQLLGFAAPGAFSTWFRQRFGTSPSEWRARARSTARAEAAAGSRG